MPDKIIVSLHGRVSPLTHRDGHDDNRAGRTCALGSGPTMVATPRPVRPPTLSRSPRIWRRLW